MKNKVMLPFIFCFLLLSFNIFSSERISFKDFSQEIEKNIKDGAMEYIKNQQCFVSYNNIVFKNFYINHVKLYATCIEIDPAKRIEWDYPKIPENAEVKTIYIFGEDMAEKIRDDLKRKKMGFLFTKLAYYKTSHEKYKKNEYFYFESSAVK
ncbi:hypothetical protein [Pseudoleptotrichia goodfellowii]|uniref:Uncharacterized protein n=1 Tax=Pseudoleptotrichia goodfellowii F0264 TaxID=596323 RepID=D0GMS8_9FUSO|nr:hypothetical protein [Pseudoleptotrichia goodfellowii]EEY34605.1 hypothetical protein HMPREF0554_0171 [Pseudoleptotrichia goodfellowii F0264]